MTTHHGIIVFCPKCNSEDIKIEDITERKSIDQLGGVINSAYIAHRIKHFRAICGNCGYMREFEEDTRLPSMLKKGG